MLPYAPLHHLLLGDLAELGVEALVLTAATSRDEPIASATATRGSGSNASPTASSSTTARSRRARTTPSCAGWRSAPAAAAHAAPLARVRAGERRPAGRRAQAAARLRRAAQGDVLPGARAPRLGEPPHRRSRALPALLAYRQGIEHFERLFALRPELVAYDLHPDYASTAYALELDGVELTGVQHHHAHLAACLAEHGLEGPAVGAIYDGSGYGTDGTIWGGEILVGDLVAFERAVSLRAGAHARRRPRRARAVADGLRLARVGARRTAAAARGARG